MALSEIKTNTQNQETKDEPQTNGSYKIKQIIIKIMEYTHMYILPKAKSKQSNLKYSRFTWRAKDIKNYIYQLRKKLKHKPENKTKIRCQVGNK